VTFRLAHLSDPHLGPLPRPHRRELLGKRVTGYLNWTRGRCRFHDMEVLAQVVADMKAHHPSHVVMTGDISNLGLPSEFQRARDWLETLGPSETVSFVPGNHDAYVRGSLPDLARAFVPWTSGETRGGWPYPYLRMRENVAIIGLSSAVPTPFFIAAGHLGFAQLARVEELLAATKRAGLIRVVVLHHPPESGPASRLSRGLIDGQAFVRLIRRAGAELILHGHDHRLRLTRLKGPRSLVPVVGVPSASALYGQPHNRAGYHLFEIIGNSEDYKITARARGLLPGSLAVGDLGALAL